jgi:hypothetical protein
MNEFKSEWRELTHSDKMKYAQGMRRLNLGFWGYPASTLRAAHLTTREGDDNTPKVFSKDLRKLISFWRSQGYDIEYCGALEHSPGKGLLHWHGLLRIKGGYFLDGNIHKVRRMLGDKWNEIHHAFVVEVTQVNNHLELREYISKHIMKEYIDEEEYLRNKFLFSKGWMRKGWKEVETLAKLWTLGGEESDGGLSLWLMNKDRWTKVNEIMQAWAEKKTMMFHGELINGEETGYLYMELGRIREISGSAFVILSDGIPRRSRFEYGDY